MKKKGQRLQQLYFPRGSMSVELQGSLRRLKATLDSMPAEERKQKEARWNELQQHLSIR